MGSAGLARRADAVGVSLRVAGEQVSDAIEMASRLVEAARHDRARTPPDAHVRVLPLLLLDQKLRAVAPGIEGVELAGLGLCEDAQRIVADQRSAS